MDSNVLSHLAITMAAISVGVERIVEILKGWFPNLFLFRTQTDPNKELQRVAWLHVLSGVLGGLIAWLSKTDVLKGVWNNSDHHLEGIGYIFAGLLASGGSALWNHILDFVKAAKVEREQGAIDVVAANAKNNLLDPSHPSAFMPLSLSATRMISTTGTSTSCSVSLSGLDFIAKKGSVISLKLANMTGNVFLDNGSCSVSVNGKSVDATTTASTIKFTAADAGPYKIQFMAAGTKGSGADLVEDCGNSVTLFKILATDLWIGNQPIAYSQTVWIQVS